MSTARDLISSSLRTIGVLASGEALPAAEAADALTTLNQLIDSWSTESLLIPNKVREVFSLTAGTSAYTMGPSGAFNTTRPQRIENVLVQLAGSASPTELALRSLTKDEYAGIALKSVQATLPAAYYSDNAAPQTTITFWPVPAGAASIAIYSWKPLAQLASLGSTLSLPPGYERALRFALAIELAPEYGKALSPEIVELAAQSKSAIKRMNTRPVYLRCDSALLGMSRRGGAPCNSGPASVGDLDGGIFGAGGDDGSAVDGGSF